MDSYRRHLHPDEMTPQERLERIIELLALAAVRCATEQGSGPEDRELSLDGGQEKKVRSVTYG